MPMFALALRRDLRTKENKEKQSQNSVSLSPQPSQYIKMLQVKHHNVFSAGALQKTSACHLSVLECLPWVSLLLIVPEKGQ